MRKFIFALLIVVLLIPQKAKPQNGAATAAALVGTAAAVGAVILAIEDLKERAELRATQWVLSNHPELTSFSLKTLDFENKKLKDMSNTTVISFKIQEFTPADKPALNGKKYVLLGFTSFGWINEQGIDFNKVSWYLVDPKEWMKMMVSYTKVASEEKNNTTIEEKLKKGVIVNRGVKVGAKTVIPFYKLEGDMYVVTDYSQDMKLVYNERSLGIFLKNTGNLVQMRRQSLIDMHEFLYPSDSSEE
jgi:hypothetical protein